MSRDWDYAVPGVRFWELAADAMLPGAHLVSFGGTRTSHRLVTAIEDAGFEIRESLLWLYGSGFPKSHNVGKAIDKMAGAERAVVDKYLRPDGTDRSYDDWKINSGEWKDGSGFDPSKRDITAPATDAAKQWDGFGTALKPSHEPICLARKPFRSTVAANVMEHGTGALNIDASRIGTDNDTSRKRALVGDTSTPLGKGYAMGGDGHTAGRWPANVLLDDEAAAMLDEQSGNVVGSVGMTAFATSIFGMGQERPDKSGKRGTADNGGASRFFYVSKASRRERGEGNIHPTCKPIALMEWLITLITPPSGVVLDPFMGSGSTLVAAARLGVLAIGIEMSEEYAEIAARRIDAALDDRENAVNQQELLMRAGG